jgi:hypothetical protein
LYYPERRYRSMITTPLRRPGEAVDLLLGTSLTEVLFHAPLKNGSRVLVWSEDERDWAGMLARIPLDPAAGRAERRELMSAKEAGCSLEEMRRLTSLIDAHALLVERVEPPAWPVPLSAEFQNWTDWWVECESMGRKSLECLSLGMWWLEREGCKKPGIMTGEIHDDGWALRVTFGRLRPHHIVRSLGRPDSMAAAHVLHFKRSAPRLLLAFRRGPAWEERDAIERRSDAAERAAEDSAGE